jgi:hypothetical protein
VPDRVVEQVAHHLLQPISVAVDQPGISLNYELDPRRFGSLTMRAHRRGEDLAQVLRRNEQLEPALVDAREGQQVLDDRAHAHDLVARAGENHAGLPREIVVAKADLELGTHRSQRGAELVRGVGNQALARLYAFLKPVEHRVQRACEVRELVPNARDRDSLVADLGDPDALGAGRHPLDGHQRLARDPPSAQGHKREGSRASEK